MGIENIPMNIEIIPMHIQIMLQNRGDIGLSLASWETTQTNKVSKCYTKKGDQNISSSLKKKRNHTQ